MRAQLTSLVDADIAAYRIGALLDSATVEVVAGFLKTVRVPVVHDPALRASGGGRFGTDETIGALRDLLLPVVTVVTPNLGEAEQLTNLRAHDFVTMQSAARELVRLGAGAALVKGGHLPERVYDVLIDAGGVQLFDTDRLPGTLRGTGCLLAAALAVALARGLPLREAVANARAFVSKKFSNARERGHMHCAY